MAAGINSGILYLEDFVDSVNTLPSDFGRLLSYIRSLDDKCNEKMAQVQECLDAFVGEYGRREDMPPAAEAARNHIENLQVQLIHFSEEKAEEMLAYHLEQLRNSCGRLTEDIRANAPADAATPSGNNNTLYREPSRSMAVFPDLLISAPEAPREVQPALRMAVPVIKTQKKAAAPPQRKSPTLAHAHSLPGPAPGPAGQQQLRPKMDAPPLGGSHAVMLSSSGNLPANITVAEPAVQEKPFYFQPLLPNLQKESPTLQAPGRLLTRQDISLNLVNKQAELLWPEDGLWYLIMITAVNVASRTADILYVTGDTEQNISLDDVAAKREMSIITAPAY